MKIVIDVKKRVENLLVKLPITNSASSIVERFNSNLIKETNISPLNEAKYLHALTKQLEKSAWIPEIQSFITESIFVINENTDYINILLVCEELKKNLNSDFYKKALSTMNDISKSNIELKNIEKMKDFTLIPQIKNLYLNLKEKLTGKSADNPNYLISNIISPILPISESNFRFNSNEKILEVNSKNGDLCEIFERNEYRFDVLVECVKMFNITQPNFVTGIRNKEVYVNLSEQVIKVDKKEISPKEISKQLNSVIGLSSVYETKQIQLLEALTSSFDSFVSIDESVKITPVKENGVSYTIFNFKDRIYGQFVNPSMKENSLTCFESKLDLLKDIKSKINYDANIVLSELIKSDVQVSEKTDILQKSLQLKIAKLQDKKNEFIKSAIESDIFNNTKIQETAKILTEQIEILKGNVESIYEKVNVNINYRNSIVEGNCYLSELINNLDVNVYIGKENVKMDRTAISIK